MGCLSWSAEPSSSRLPAMRSVRISSPLGRLLWVAYLAVALVFIQGMRLHLHVYDHDPATPEHAHLEQAHFAYDATETGHSDEIAKIDLSHQGALKTLSLGALAIALFAVLLLLLSPGLCSQLAWRRYRLLPRNLSPDGLRPPLRAPPL